MARKPSIPTKLRNAILKRWRGGESPNDIVAWIERTNGDRAEPVHTSRSSIQRLVDSLADCEGVRLQAIRRIRLQAGDTLDALEAVNAGLRQCVVDADSQVPFKKDRAQFKLKALATQHATLHRDLKLAAITGAAAEQLVYRHRVEHEDVVQDLRYQADLAEQGIAPERDESDAEVDWSTPPEVPKVPDSISLESQSFVESKRAGAPAHDVPEAVTAAPANEAEPKVPDSIPLESQPIGESKRAGPPANDVSDGLASASANDQRSQRLDAARPAA